MKWNNHNFPSPWISLSQIIEAWILSTPETLIEGGMLWHLMFPDPAPIWSSSLSSFSSSSSTEITSNDGFFLGTAAGFFITFAAGRFNTAAGLFIVLLISRHHHKHFQIKMIKCIWWNKLQKGWSTQPRSPLIFEQGVGAESVCYLWAIMTCIQSILPLPSMSAKRESILKIHRVALVQVWQVPQKCR